MLAAPPAVTDLPWSLWEFVHRVPFRLDKQPLDFERHPYLVPVYQAINFDPKVHPEAFRFVLMTGAQVGKTGAAFGALTLAALKWWGGKFGYFLPDQQMADIFSSVRFKPLIVSNPFLRGLWGEDTGGMPGARVAEDRKRVRTLGETTIFFSYMGGKTSTEAIPMHGVFFDEVRQMFMADIERAQERYSHSPYPIDFKISTARHPDTTIDYFFKRSTQHVWHSRCRCPEGVALAWCWPDCIGEHRGALFYRCPTCGTRIDEPRDGRYVPRAPEAKVVGFHIPQILAPGKTAASLWEKWSLATDRQEFYNSTLGIPWVDPESILVPESVALACVEQALRWERTGENCVMGVDQRGGENHVVVGKRERGKLRLVHLEIVQGEEPFDRLYRLMEQFDVDCCVLDALPSYNEAVRFGRAFKRRVFLAYYSPNVNMIRWSDRDEELKALVRAEKDAKFEFHVMLDRYKVIEHALMHWVLRSVACPPPEALVQEVIVQGLNRHSLICKGNPETREPGLFWHLRSVARRKVEIQRRDSKAGETFETGEFTMAWENIGIDPHFLHAFTYCTVAASRRDVLTQLWTGPPPAAATVQDVLAEQPTLTPTQAADAVQLQRHVLPVVQAAEAARPRIEGTCGACVGFDARTGHCGPRRMGTQASYPACEFYEARAEEAG